MKVLSTTMYRSKKAFETKKAFLEARKLKSTNVNELKAAHTAALKQELLMHKNKEIPIYGSGIVHGSNADFDWTIAKYFAVPAKWSVGSQAEAYVLYAYLDYSGATGTFDPVTYCLGIYCKYPTGTESEDLLGGNTLTDVCITGPGFGNTAENTFGLLRNNFSDNDEDGLLSNEELDLIARAIGFNPTDYATFYANFVPPNYFNGKVSGALKTLHITQIADNLNVNTLTFEDDANLTGWMWAGLIFFFVLLLVIYWDEWFPRPHITKA